MELHKEVKRSDDRQAALKFVLDNMTPGRYIGSRDMHNVDSGTNYNSILQISLFF